MTHIISFLFHFLFERVFKHVWGRDTLLSPSTLLRNRYVISKVHEQGRENAVYLAGDGQIFLVDFGFARAYKPAGEAPLQAGPAIPRPAVLENTKVFDPQMARPVVPRVMDRRSDQYSLAATLYCLLTGAPPPDSMDRLAGKPELTPIRASRPDLSASAEQAIFRALSLDQNRRYSDIEEFKMALIGGA